MDALRTQSALRYLNEAELAPGADPLELRDTLRELLLDAGEELNRQFSAGRSVSELLRERAMLIDEVLRFLWQRLDAGGPGVALVAVGGYGRGELHPCSDIDVLVLRGGAGGPTNGLEQFLTLLWDIGLKIGHSVRSVEECLKQARADVTVLTNLLEARLLIGDPQLLDAVEAGIAAPNMWPAEEFFRAKVAEQGARHAKYADTEYSLEPNIKSSPGGLRDLQLIGWLARRHFGWSELGELTANRFLT
ncbi:MAG: nucleotidyltransferase domain-containing protein, partial [Pseudomonadota bacterium]